MAQLLPRIFIGAFLLLISGMELTQAQIFYSRPLKVKFLSAKLDTSTNSIKIKYDLKGPKNRYYNLQLLYSNNKGNSFKGPLRSLSGDFGDSVQVGKSKVVSWSFLKDNPYFNGKNIMFRIEAEEIPKIAKGGPKNALWSLLLPGLGDLKVRNGYHYEWITATTFALLGAGTLFYIKANNELNDYNNRVPNTLSDHQQLFNKARTSSRLAYGFFIAGGAVWIADIVGVYLRGLKNKRMFAPKKEEDKKKTAFLMPLIVPNVNQYTGSSQISLIWRF
ncbi:hypothetical protein [Microscilla marina]|nr:hypothetical protein [Microscilla marina]